MPWSGPVPTGIPRRRDRTGEIYRRDGDGAREVGRRRGPMNPNQRPPGDRSGGSGGGGGDLRFSGSRPS